MTSDQRPPVPNSTRNNTNNNNISVESFPYIVDDRYYLRRMKEILQDALPKPSLPSSHDQVSDHVFIGNQRNADDTTGLRSAGIDHVLSCAASRRSTESPYDQDSGIVDYFLIPAEDREDFDITRYFDAAFLFLDRVKRRRGKALVHCNMGVNRSGAIVAAYLMVDEKKSLLEVISFLKTKRRLILSNKGFRMQLIQFARDRGLLDPVIDTVTRISYMDERRRAKSEGDGVQARRKAQEQSTKVVEDRTTFRRAVCDSDHDLSSGNDTANGRENEAEQLDRTWKENSGIKLYKAKESTVGGDPVLLNGSFDSSFLRPIQKNSRISTFPVKPNVSDQDSSPRKYSSSVQYWPTIEIPRKFEKSFTTNGDQHPGSSPGTEQAPAVTKRRKYVRTRSDCRTGTSTDSEKPVPASTEQPHRLLSTIFCTLRAKPKRNSEVEQNDGIENGFQRLQIRDKEISKYQSRSEEINLKSSQESANSKSFLDGTSSATHYRSKWAPGTPADRPSSSNGTADAVGRNGVDERPSNGFLIFYGRKIVHARSSSQWNLSALDKDIDEPFISTESPPTRAGTNYRDRSRRNLAELSGIGGAWRSAEKISESKSVYLIRKDFY